MKVFNFKNILFCLSLLLFSQPLFAFQLILANPQNLSSKEKAQAQSLIKDVQSALPDSFKLALKNPIDIYIVDMPDSSAILGYAKNYKNQIYLNKKTLRWDEGVVVGNKTITYSLAKMNLAHEISHIYDHSRNPSNSMTPGYCHHQEQANETFECKTYRNWTTVVSSDPRFLAVSQFSAGPKIETLNRNIEAYPETYASTSHLEAFAVYFSYYIFDSEFACKVPALEEYFAQHFNQPSRASRCSQNLKWFNSQFGTTYETPVSRIYAADYFWASEGKSTMSRFGHGMIRLVVCAPSRKNVSEECYKDVNHHIVLSYAAASRETSFSALAGLNGKYPMNLYVSSVADKQIEYGMAEFRNLISIPLKLSRTELEAFAKHLNYEHWNYDGSYYFISRNCTTEIIRGLTAAGVSLGKIFEIQTSIPSDLFKGLLNKSSGLSNYRSLEQLKANPSLFYKEPTEYVQIALKNIAASLNGESIVNLQTYIAKISNEDLLGKIANLNLTQKQWYSLYYIERIRLATIERDLSLEFMKNSESIKQYVDQQASQLLGLTFNLRVPGKLIDERSYGIPNDRDLENFNNKYLALKTSLNTEKSESVLKASQIINQKLEPQRRLMNEIIARTQQ